MAITRRGLVATLVGAVLSACGAPAPPAEDDAEIQAKTRNPPPAAVRDQPLEPPDSRFTIPLPDFIPMQTLIRRWRINTVERNTSIDLKSWSLTVDGLVDRPLTLSYEALLQLPPLAQTNDLHCVEGWGFYDIRWEGVHLSTLFDRVGVMPEATHVSFYTFPKVYTDSLTLDQARLPDTMLAHRANDAPLTEDHGYPLRLVVPSMYGYKSVKWVDRVELVRGRHVGYWEKRGWRPDPWIR